MRALLGALPLLVLVLACLHLQTSRAGDIYLEGQLDAENEYLEVKSVHKRDTSGWFDWFSPTSVKPPDDDADSDPDDNGGSGMPDQGIPDQVIPDQGIPDQVIPDQVIPDQGIPDQGIPDQGLPEVKEKTLRVSFVVMEPYRQEYSSRDSLQFQNLSKSLADAVNQLLEDLPGTQRASLVRIESRPDQFTCVVTLDIASSGYDNTDKISEILSDHIKRGYKLGTITVSHAGFTSKVNPDLLPSARILDDDVTQPLPTTTLAPNYCRGGASATKCENSELSYCPEQTCDGSPFCPYGDDERRCDKECLHDEFQCDRTRCIRLEQRCDETFDCDDHTDEENCGARE